jgi:hypothetical protein
MCTQSQTSEDGRWLVGVVVLLVEVLGLISLTLTLVWTIHEVLVAIM